jgi:hypothetical protein
LAGLIGVVPQLVQGGVVFQVSTSMQIQVGASVWQLPDPTNALATFLAATDGAFLNFAAGPATGSRIDLIAVKQNNPENGDADSRANIVILPGVAGAPGVPPAVPAGYFRFADILVPTNAANAAACTVTVHTPTTFAPPDLTASTLAALQIVTGQLGQTATVTGDTFNNGLYAWRPGSPGSWALVAPSQEAAFICSASGAQVIGTSWTQLTGWNATPDANRGFTSFTGGALTVAVTGIYDLAAELFTATSGQQSVAVTKNSTTVASGVILLSQQSGLSAGMYKPVVLAAGDVLRVFGAAAAASQTVSTSSFVSAVWRASV